MLPQIKLNIVLHQNQKTIHACKARFKAIKTGKRFGKTYLMAYELIQAALERPGVYWYSAPTYRQAKSIAWHLFLWLLPARLVRRKLENELLIETVNGSRIELKGEDNEDSLRGPALDGLVRDEVSLNPRGDYVWSAIYRGQLASTRGWATHISSPNPKGRNWYSNFCEDAKRKMDSGDPDWAYFFYTIHDNPTLPPDEIEAIRRTVPDYIWDLEYMAQETEMAGQKFSEFQEERNVGEVGEGSFPVYRGIDWGISHPTVCLWAKLDEESRTVWVYDEFVKSGLVIQESCRVIKEKTGASPVEWTVIDPSTAKRNSQTGRSDALEFNRYGIPTVMADNRDRGVDIVKMFLKTGRLKISPRCKNLIWELRNLQWGDTEGDDCTDALRYLVLRIHDTIAGMNIFEAPKDDWKPSNPRELRMKDFFKEDSRDSGEMSWLLREVG